MKSKNKRPTVHVPAIHAMSVPVWAIKKQHALEKIRPHFGLGDIVMVDESKDPHNDPAMRSYRAENYKLGVIVRAEVLTADHTALYAIYFGPSKGEASWFREQTLTMVRRAE